MSILRTLALTGLIASFGTASQAGLCDYKPTTLLAKTTSNLGANIVNGAVAAGRHSANYYTLTHAGASLPALETAATSATGTVTAILTAPAAMIIGGITIIGVGAYEGACYFKVDRVTDPYEVRRIIESVAAEDPAVAIIRTDNGDAMTLNEAGETNTYLLRNLYIADGQLKHRDFGFNTDLGPILYRTIPQPAAAAPAAETIPEAISAITAPEAMPETIETTPIAPERPAAPEPQAEPQPKTNP